MCVILGRKAHSCPNRSEDFKFNLLPEQLSRTMHLCVLLLFCFWEV